MREEVVAAAFAELLDRGYEAMTLSSIARRAGVDRVTLYRRWGSVPAIMADALGAGSQPTAADVPDTGSLRGDVRALFRLALQWIDSPLLLAVTRALNAATAPELAQVRAEIWKARQESLAALVQRAVDRGEIAEPLFPVERVADAVFGAAQFRLLIRGSKASAKEIEHSVALVCFLVTGDRGRN